MFPGTFPHSSVFYCSFSLITFYVYHLSLRAPFSCLGRTLRYGLLVAPTNLVPETSRCIAFNSFTCTFTAHTLRLRVAAAPAYDTIILRAHHTHLHGRSGQDIYLGAGAHICHHRFWCRDYISYTFRIAALLFYFPYTRTHHSISVLFVALRQHIYLLPLFLVAYAVVARGSTRWSLRSPRIKRRDFTTPTHHTAHARRFTVAYTLRLPHTVTTSLRAGL